MIYMEKLMSSPSPFVFVVLPFFYKFDQLFNGNCTQLVLALFLFFFNFRYSFSFFLVGCSPWSFMLVCWISVF